MRREFNVLALVKGSEQYVYVYDDQSADDLIKALRNQAADAALSLTWFDVMVLSRKAREQTEAAQGQPGPAPSRI